VGFYCGTTLFILSVEARYFGMKRLRRVDRAKRLVEQQREIVLQVDFILSFG
jgi:bisphosphoglycerate-independent phosphoglycerate mutase (AlkP superfamily)